MIFRFVLFLVVLFCSHTVFAKEAKITTRKDSVSYSIGFNLGKSLLSQFQTDSLDVDVNLLILGTSDALLEKQSKIPESVVAQYIAELQMIITKRRQEQMARAEKELKEQAEKNLKSAQTFLEENKKKPDINETNSGLQYKVLKLGSGKKPLATNKVKVHYRGTLLDGTVFDDSYSRGNPAEFELDKVIRGFQEGLLNMPEGSKFILYIPPSLGYGDRQVGKIPPNSLLIFEVELFEVKD
ncbi:MAG: FKBP-type peptidyl-prolyl cis-trans isomerase [Candidatus Kapaibacteriota bacterium]